MPTPSPARPRATNHRLNASNSTSLLGFVSALFHYFVLYLRSLFTFNARSVLYEPPTGPTSAKSTSSSYSSSSRTASAKSGTVKPITSDSQFSTEIAYKGLTVVDFYATWCGPCKQLAPFLDSLAQANPRVNFLKVDVDSMSSLAQRYGITAMPTIKFFKNGSEIHTIKGADFSAISSQVARHG